MNYFVITVSDLYHSRSDSNHDHITSAVERIANSVNDGTIGKNRRNLETLFVETLRNRSKAITINEIFFTSEEDDMKFS